MKKAKPAKLVNFMPAPNISVLSTSLNSPFLQFAGKISPCFVEQYNNFCKHNGMKVAFFQAEKYITSNF